MQTKTIKAWLNKAASRISRLDAELILLRTLKAKDRTFLIAHSDQILSEKQLKELEKNLSRRQNGEPIAYITGKKEFYGYDFYVDKNVLVPRPETEALVEYALHLISTKTLKKILEVGIGSGCISISIAKELEKMNQTNISLAAVDISNPAIKIAKKNLKNLNPKIPIQISKNSLLENQTSLPDLIIANLPYVDRSWDWLSPKLNFEPEIALYAENNGLKLIFNLIDQAKSLKKDQAPHYLVLEADPIEHQDIVNHAKKNGFKLEYQKDFVLSFSF